MIPPPVRRLIGLMLWSDGTVTWERKAGGATMNVQSRYTGRIHHFHPLGSWLLRAAHDSEGNDYIRVFEERGEPEPCPPGWTPP